MNLLRAWRNSFDDIDDCPWAGPRPQRGRPSGGVQGFHGRGVDAENIAQIIRENSVVVLSGASGVGKTSALYQAVRPQLEDRGWKVMLCDKWSPPRTFDAEDLVAKQVSGQLPRGVRLGKDRPSLIAQLDRYYPDKSVIVLDQFEELIRYRRGAYHQVLRWIEKTAETSRVRIVISLRVEHEHELKGPGGLRLRAFTDTMHCELAPITEAKVIKEIIDAGKTSTGHPAATSGATDLLLEAWEWAHGRSDWSEVGLLHLQATLYSLWHGKKGDVIEGDDVTRLMDEANIFSADQASAETIGLYEYGLSKCVEISMQHCRRACDDAGVDRQLAARSRELIADMTMHLSSGGYKISLDRDELADRLITATKVLDRTRAAENAARTKLAQIVDDAAAGSMETDEGPISFDALTLPDELDWLSVRRPVLFGDAYVGEGKWPWKLDPEDATGGALLGLRPVESVVEELRSLHFALEWLRTCDLVRVTSTEPGKVMVSLNHDRFAAGLARWRQYLKLGSDEAISRVAAIRGDVLDWSAESGPIAGGVVVNVRWADCQITRAFVGTTFVNCDFRGSTFRGCKFDGVSFVNCLLDDVEFLDCTIVGQPGPLPTDLSDEQIREQPSFLVSAPDLVPILHRYRETTDNAGDGDGASLTRTQIFSRTAGVAAVPAAETDVASVACDPQPQPGGLTMYGGFLSSLKVRACSFPDGGTLSLRHVAGTSVEFAELTEANVQVFAAALRGLTVTLPISELRGSAKDDEDSAVEAPRGDAEQIVEAPFHLDLRDSRIINAWFGPGIAGDAEFTNCLVWQVFNGSGKFNVTLPNSPLMGAVNIQQTDGLVPFEIVEGVQYKDLLVETIDGLEQLVLDASTLIDYRRRPAKYELSRRSESGASDAAGEVE